MWWTRDQPPPHPLPPPDLVLHLSNYPTRIVISHFEERSEGRGLMSFCTSRRLFAWGYLPEVFGPRQAVWTWHHRLATDVTWDKVEAKLTAAADAAGLIDWSLSVGSTITRAHQHATKTTRITGGWVELHESTDRAADQGIGRSRGGLSTTIHQLVDGNGLPLVTLITPGQAGDSPMFLPLMAQLRVVRDTGGPRTRPAAGRGDKAYSSRAIRGHFRARGIKAVIPDPDDQKGHHKRQGFRGARPVRLNAPDYKNRNGIERRYCHTKQWRGLDVVCTTDTWLYHQARRSY